MCATRYSPDNSARREAKSTSGETESARPPRFSLRPERSISSEARSKAPAMMATSMFSIVIIVKNVDSEKIAMHSCV